VVLRDLLSDLYPKIKIAGTASNGHMAIELIHSIQPDLIFLDVEMPDMNGFDVLASLDKIRFQTIFVTAHLQYAIQAIRFNALDYLVKPIDPKELMSAMRRFYSKKNIDQQDQVQNAIENYNKVDVQEQILYLPTQDGGLKMKLGNIIRIEGARNYSTFHLATKQKKISSKTLGHFEEILEGKGFYRCHRSFIVNHNYIQKIHKDFFLLKNLNHVPISRRRKSLAKKWFFHY